MANDTEFKFPDETPGGIENEKQEELQIEIEDDTPVEDRGRAPLTKPVAEPTDEELASYSEKVQKRIKELTHARHDDRRRAEALQRERDELERVARQALEQNSQIRKQYEKGATEHASLAKTAAKAEIDTIKAKLKAAHEAFDPEAISNATAELFAAQQRLHEAEKFTPPVAQEPETDVPSRQFTAPSVKPDEKTLNWQAKNQWFGSPGYEEVTSFALGVHQRLVNSGVDPQSDTYFERLNARITEKFPEVTGNGGRESPSGTPQATRRPGSVVAAVQRSSGPKTVKLTSTQVALAAKLGLTPQQYAAAVAKMEN